MKRRWRHLFVFLCKESTLTVGLNFGEYKLGFIPRDENREISKYLDMGYGDIYETRIIRLSPQEHPEQQVEVTVKIKKFA